MNKELIKKRIQEIHQDSYNELKRAYEDLKVSSDLDESETKDKEDLSNKDVTQEMLQEMEQHLHGAEMELNALMALPTHSFDTSEVGALIETNHQTFLVSVPTKPFDFEGKTVVGISAQAPLFLTMHGKKAGDSFRFHQTDYKILNIQ